MPKPLPIRSMQAGKILARLHDIHYWPFRDKQFAILITEAEEGELELLAYCAIGATDEEFKTKMEKMYHAKFPPDK